MTEQRAGSEEQRRDRVTFRAGTAEQTVVGGDAPIAVVVKMRNQWVIEYHGIVAKLTACQARAETNRGALATAKRARRIRCRP